MPEPFVISRFRHSSMMDQYRKRILCAKRIYDFEESFTDGVTTVFAESDSRGIIYTSLTFDISDFDENELFGVSV